MKLYKFNLLFLFLLITFKGQASLVNLSRELIKKNTIILNLNKKVELDKLIIQSLFLKESFNFFYSFDYTNSFLEQISFSQLPFKGPVHIFSIEKNYISRGLLLKLDSSFLTKRFKGVSPLTNSADGRKQFHIFKQVFNLEQDLSSNFWGKRFKKELGLARLKKELSQLRHDESRQRQLLNLVIYYIQSSLSLNLISLQKESLFRSKRRLLLVKRWVQDGLRENVDLYQAKASVYKKEENIKTAKRQLEQSLAKMSKLFHRKVLLSEINPMKTIENTLILRNSLTNKKLALLKKSQDIAEISLKLAYDEVRPRLKFIFRYETNDVSFERGKSFWRGSFLGNGGDSFEAKVGINIIWPLGLDVQKNDRAKARLLLEIAKNESRGLGKDLEQEERSLKNRIQFLKENLTLVKERLILSKKSLKEYNKLYSTGRTDIDQVIRAEETLIRTEIEHINYTAELKNRHYQLNYLFGQIGHVLLGDR